MSRALRVLALAFALPCAGTGYALEIGVQSQVVIALPARPSPDESLAAQELQRYLQLATGQRLDIVTEAEATAPAVILGLTRAAAELGLPDPELGRAGFIVQSHGDDLVIAGNNGLGTRYGVYWLLGQRLGVRWYIPTEMFEIVPKLDKVTLEDLCVREIPAFEPRTYRCVWQGRDCSYVGEKDPVHGCDLWATRNLLTVDGRGAAREQPHNLQWIIVPSRYRDEHPEYLPLLEGRRLLPEDTRHNWQPCITDPHVIAIAAQGVLDYFAANPSEETFWLGINDAYGWCECPRCRAADGPERHFRGRPVHSGRYYRFVNEVARRVAKTYPDKLLGCTAYMNVELPPDFPLEPNVSVWVTQDTAQHHNPSYERTDYDTLRRWTEVCQHVGKYDYYGLTWVMPRYFPAEIARDLRFGRQVRVEGFYAEDVPTWGTMGPLLWISARLLWDPELDPQKLQAQFCRDCFGAAAEPMNCYFSLLQRTWCTPREGKWLGGLCDIRRQVSLYSPEVAQGIEVCLSQAADLADTPKAAERVDFFRRAWQLCAAYVREADLLAQLGSQPADADSLIAAAQAMRQLSQGMRRRQRLTEEIEADDLLGGTIQWILRRLDCGATWDQQLAAALSEATVRCEPALVAVATGLDETALAALARRLRGTTLRLIARGLLMLNQSEGEVQNLVANPGFEMTHLGGGPTEDWQSGFASPPGWTTWHVFSKHAEFYWQRGHAHSGQFCVRLQGCEADACFIHKVAVEPGAEYVARVFARSDGGPNAEAWMRIRWQNRERHWIAQEEDIITNLRRGRGWQALYAAFEVPSEAAYAVILLVASGQNRGESAWFDDVTVACLPEAE